MSRYKWQRHSTYGFKTTFVMISNKHEQFRKKKKFKFYGKKIISIHVSSAFDCLWSGYSENVFDMIIQCELLTQMKKKNVCLILTQMLQQALWQSVYVAVCLCILHDDFRPKSLNLSEKKNESYVFQPVSMRFCHKFIVMLCWENEK